MYDQVNEKLVGFHAHDRLSSMMIEYIYNQRTVETRSENEMRRKKQDQQADSPLNVDVLVHTVHISICLFIKQFI